MKKPPIEAPTPQAIVQQIENALRVIEARQGVEGPFAEGVRFAVREFRAQLGPLLEAATVRPAPVRPSIRIQRRTWELVSFPEAILEYLDEQAGF